MLEEIFTRSHKINM